MGTPSFADLVDRQVRAWQEQEHVAPEPGQGPTRQRPMIAVSRTYGALGGLVAQQAAALLGFDLFDREVVDRVARTAQVSQRVVESVDERLQDAISNWVADLFGAGRLAHHDYLATLARVVLTAGHHGRGVIVGRCASSHPDRRRRGPGPRGGPRARGVLPSRLRTQPGGPDAVRPGAGHGATAGGNLRPDHRHRVPGAIPGGGRAADRRPAPCTVIRRARRGQVAGVQSSVSSKKSAGYSISQNSLQ